VQRAPGIPCALSLSSGRMILQSSGGWRREIANPHP
jgi:hypothetical protein